MRFIVSIAIFIAFTITGWAQSDLDYDENIFSGSAGATPYNPSSELEEYSKCVSKMQKEVALFNRAVVMSWFSFDRKLLWMVAGVQALGENYALLTLESAKAVQDPIKRHLLSNAVEGCHSYKAKFEKRLKKIILLAASVSGLLITLLLSLGFKITNRKSDPVSSDEPQDKKHITAL